MARTFWKGTSPPYPHPDWHNSTTTPGYFWKGDTSSDEVTLFFSSFWFHSICSCRQLATCLRISSCSILSPKRRRRKRASAISFWCVVMLCLILESLFCFVQNFVDYVMANNWKLIDVTGKPTTWGLLVPLAFHLVCFVFLVRFCCVAFYANRVLGPYRAE